METTNEQPTIPAFQVGNTAIYVQSSFFQRGYELGYRMFYKWYAGKDIYDWNIYTFILHNIADSKASRLESAGYITGWMAALIEHRQATCEQDTTTTVEVQ